MRTLVVSPSTLNTFQLCARKFNYEKNIRLALAVTPKRFDKGTLIHWMLEQYYKGKLAGAEAISVQDICDAAMQKSLELPDIMPSDVADVIATFRRYTEQYRNEQWQIIAVEASFSKILFETDDLRILIEGKVDLIAETNTRFVVDHKSMDRFSQPPFLSNQMMAYCWAFDLSSAIYNRMKIPAEDKADFQRPTVSYSADQLEEWRYSAVYWAMKIDEALQTEAYPPNNTSCDKYGKCAFIRLCSANPSVRPEIMVREYKTLPQHDLFPVPESTELDKP